MKLHNKTPIKIDTASEPLNNKINFKKSTTQSSNVTGLSAVACLRNLGSTCYINCIIQVIRYTPGFVSSIHRLNKQIENLESLVILY